jgi:hypothetical protein
MGYSFNPDTHTHYVDGVPVPGVTSVIDAMGLISPFCKVPEAAERGRNGHTLCQLCYSGEIDDYNVPEVSRPWVCAILRFMRDFDIMPYEFDASKMAIEFPVWSKFGYAGIPDLLSADLTLWDNKFWGSIGKQSLGNAGIQTAAYAQAIKERHGITVKKRKVVIFNIDNSRPYEVRGLNDPSDLPVFMGALNVYKRLSQYQKMSTEDLTKGE